jgi:hypothetical protein
MNKMKKKKLSPLEQIEKELSSKKITLYTKDLRQILLDVMNLGMVLRQNQLNGYSTISGKELLNDWIEKNHKEFID